MGTVWHGGRRQMRASPVDHGIAVRDMGLLRHRFRASTLELPFRLGGESSRVAALRVVRFNGQEGDFNDYKTVMGFVPQEIGCMDQFGCWAVKMWCMKDLQQGSESEVVGEQIRFSADLRNAYDTDVNVPWLKRAKGKRVSIGLELAADPTMLFLDEPTSGLDAASSLAIVQSLKRMSQLGMTSVLVVHQPRFSLFSLFDDVLLLGKGGRTVYFGPPKSAKLCPFGLGFVMPKSENPADWFMDLISGEVPNQKIPHFVPEMLFDIWELNKDRVQRKARA
ncbi:ABC transporter G family member 25 (OsABCG25) (Putative white-brown complex homolog protein 26) (OsWBC26) [Durusdinium trenchii]|uniref:ABC transporter G family member 25 (OsABCG25) (Putative white-brown complex homolog protein 26) (OsWBC26) n=1 Tax=Durusdinium trenchii TaxID=1381693 RepID=A0ABP0M2I6_9DINO